MALWGFAAFVTLREGVNLLWVTTLDTGVGKPTESLLSALQQERRISLAFLGGRRPDQRTALVNQRTGTDEAVGRFRRLVQSDDVQFAASAPLRQRLTDVMDRLTALNRARVAIDGGAVDRLSAANAFTEIIDAGFRIYGSLATLDDQDIAKNVRTLIAFSRAREVVSQEDALISGALAAGRPTAPEYQRFVELVGIHRFLYADAEVELPPADRAAYQQVIESDTAGRFRDMEDRLIQRIPAGWGPVVDAPAWDAVAVPFIGQLRGLELAGGRRVVGQARPAAVGVIVRLGLAGGLGFLAVLASIIMSITTARALVRQLQRLRDAALELANVRLPGVVDRLRRGERVDVDSEAPPLSFGPDEIGQVGTAFNAVQQTAVRAAVEQAELRRGVRDVFLNLARRTQALVHRQLTVLDGMERHEAGAETLENLFRVDHLATRMRRNAENLIVLSGAAPGRGWRHPVALVDVVRGAVAEVEDYARVTVLPMDSHALAGRAVGDLIHLLAELIENALSFSPPYTIVQVGGHLVANGFAVEVEDRGLGMSEADLAAANDQLREPPEFNVASTARLGLYVVGRLAIRHGVQVRLKDSAYGGTTAVVLIPRALVEESALQAEPDVPTAPMPLSTVPPVVPALAAPQPADSGDPSAGLPRRVRQANLPVALRGDPAVPAAEADAPPTTREPEEVRALMSSYRTGTILGRFDALRSPDSDAAPAPTQPTDRPDER